MAVTTTVVVRELLKYMAHTCFLGLALLIFPATFRLTSWWQSTVCHVAQATDVAFLHPTELGDIIHELDSISALHDADCVVYDTISTVVTLHGACHA